MIIKVKIGKRIFRVKDCKGLSSLRGLMFDDLANKDGALIYASSSRWTRNASVCIWMPFVRKRLHLVFMDKNMKVVDKKIAVPLTLNPKTWKTYKNKKAKYCLELKGEKLKIAKGTRIKML